MIKTIVVKRSFSMRRDAQIVQERWKIVSFRKAAVQLVWCTSIDYSLARLELGLEA